MSQRALGASGIVVAGRAPASAGGELAERRPGVLAGLFEAGLPVETAASLRVVAPRGDAALAAARPRGLMAAVREAAVAVVSPSLVEWRKEEELVRMQEEQRRAEQERRRRELEAKRQRDEARRRVWRRTMDGETKASLDTVRRLGERFVAEHYPEELTVFEPIWSVVAPWLTERQGLSLDGRAGEQLSADVVKDVGFAYGAADDVVTPVVLALEQA